MMLRWVSISASSRATRSLATFASLSSSASVSRLAPGSGFRRRKLSSVSTSFGSSSCSEAPEMSSYERNSALFQAVAPLQDVSFEDAVVDS